MTFERKECKVPYMNPATTPIPRDAALSVHEHARGVDYEVELFGPVDMPSGEVKSGHRYRRYVQSLDLAEAMIAWWLDGGPEPAEMQAQAGEAR